MVIYKTVTQLSCIGAKRLQLIN